MSFKSAVKTSDCSGCDHWSEREFHVLTTRFETNTIYLHWHTNKMLRGLHSCVLRQEINPISSSMRGALSCWNVKCPLETHRAVWKLLFKTDEFKRFNSSLRCITLPKSLRNFLQLINSIAHYVFYNLQRISGTYWNGWCIREVDNAVYCSRCPVFIGTQYS